MDSTERAQRDREEDTIVDAIWGDEDRVLGDGEAQHYQINFAMVHEHRAQENMRRLAHVHLEHLICPPLLFSEMELTPTHALATSLAW